MPADEAERVGQHLATCEPCRADLANLANDQRRFEREVFPQTREAVARRGSPGRWRLLLPSLGVAVAAAAAWLLFLRPSLPGGDELGVKGAATLAIFAAGKQGAVPVGDGTALRPGDRIRFVLWPAGQRHAVIASIDGAGKATIYHPFGGRESARLPEGMRVEVPGSIELDASPGPERVFAVLAPRPFSTASVLELLRKLGARGPAAIRQSPTLPLTIESATQQSILVEKTP
jgi:hypothetical protein